MLGPLLRATAAAASLAALAAPTVALSDDHERPLGDVTEPASRAAAEPVGDVLPLTLADAIALGLENNLDVEIARYDPLIATEDNLVAWGAYDPSLSGRLDYDDGEEPTGNLLAGAIVSTETLAGNARLQQLLPFIGASVFADFAASRTETDRNFTALSPLYDSTVSVGGTLPLARGLIWNQQWTQVRTSKLLSEAAAEQFRTSLMDIVSRIEGAYWSLVATGEQRRVAIKSLEAAEALAEQVDTQFEVGVVSKVDVVEAEAGVAERELNMITAKNAHDRAQDLLIDNVLGAQLRAASALQVRATDSPDEIIDYQVDLERAVQRAFELRPELANAKRSLEAAAVRLKFARNQRLPQVDLVGSYRVGGIRGVGNETANFGGGSAPQCQPEVVDLGAGMVVANPTFNPLDPACATTTTGPTTGRGISDTFDDYGENTGRDGYSVGAVVTIPIGNVAGRHNVSRSKLELRRAESQLKRLRQSVILEVRDAARNLKTSIEGIEAAERRRLAAEEQLRAERIRLEHGESTPFEVLQRERDLVDAESQKIAAFQTYRTSVTALERAQGTLLRSRRVSVEDAAALR